MFTFLHSVIIEKQVKRSISINAELQVTENKMEGKLFSLSLSSAPFIL